jgi:hypothetical protein
MGSGTNTWHSVLRDTTKKFAHRKYLRVPVRSQVTQCCPSHHSANSLSNIKFFSDQQMHTLLT